MNNVQHFTKMCFRAGNMFHFQEMQYMEKVWRKKYYSYLLIWYPLKHSIRVNYNIMMFGHSTPSNINIRFILTKSTQSRTHPENVFFFELVSMLIKLSENIFLLIIPGLWTIFDFWQKYTKFRPHFDEIHPNHDFFVSWTHFFFRVDINVG